jgi:hypothetical protein
MTIGVSIIFFLAILGFACVWFLLGFGVLMLFAWFYDWWSAIGKDPMKDFYNGGLPAKKSHK